MVKELAPDLKSSKNKNKKGRGACPPAAWLAPWKVLVTGSCWQQPRAPGCGLSEGRWILTQMPLDHHPPGEAAHQCHSQCGSPTGSISTTPGPVRNHILRPMQTCWDRVSGDRTENLCYQVLQLILVPEHRKLCCRQLLCAVSGNSHS